VKSKHHFANSAEPLKEGALTDAVCGAKVPKAVFAAEIDCAIVGFSFAMKAIKGMCTKCSDADDPGKRFWYVVREARDEEQES